MKKENVTEQCPKCGAKHKQGNFGEYKETHPHQHEGKEVVICSAPDIKCKCGLELQWVVPLFRVSASGYILSPKPDHRNFRKAQ